jgi:hypothetical protein
METITIDGKAGTYLPEEKVAQILGVKIESLRVKRSREADHPPFVRLGRKTFYPADRFEKWVHARIQGRRY